MPTRTNSNHATLMTGVQPEAHGITGNAVWDRAAGAVRKLGAAADFLAETIFTLAHRAGRGHAHGDRGRQAEARRRCSPPTARGKRRRTSSGTPRAASDSSKDEVTGYAYDGTTLAAART